MTKKMRELQAKMAELRDEAKGYMAEGEGKDLAKAEETLDKIDALQKEYDLEERMMEAAKGGIPAEIKPEGKANGFKAMTKLFKKARLTDEEKALITGDAAANGENYLVPDDVRAEINELRKTYVSAKALVTVDTTDALAGSVNYEAGTPAGLADFEDGGEIAAETDPTFVKIPFKIGFKGKLIPISRILQKDEKGGLMGYLNRWFVRNAIITENTAIFDALKAGYNDGTPKALAGWKALKKSINKDLDPACLYDGVIITNQSGFAALDEEEDKDGRPVLQPNPAHPTAKLFQGMTVHVFPDAQLPNIDGTHFPVIYGSTKAGCTFVEHDSLQFTVSEHYLFNKNQNCLRVLEGFDVMSTDKTAYIYGSFAASTTA